VVRLTGTGLGIVLQICRFTFREWSKGAELRGCWDWKQLAAGQMNLRTLCYSAGEDVGSFGPCQKTA